MKIVTADREERIIRGIVVPYGTPGMTSAGLVTVTRGALTLPTKLERVKLLSNHSNGREPAEPIGYAIDAQDTIDGLEMTFKIAETTAGFTALLEAEQGVRDGLSIELAQTKIHRDEVTAARVMAVAHVTLPAYDDARITSVAANYQEDKAMGKQGDLGALVDELRRRDMVDSEAIDAFMDEYMDTQDTDADTGEQETAEAADADTGDRETVAASRHDSHTVAAGAPALVATHSSNDTGIQSMSELAATVKAVATGERSPQLTAALEDVAYSSSPFGNQPDYVGELWSGVEYTRRWVPLLDTSSPLNALKVKGWRWTTPPKVSEWDGDKAAVPSNQPAWTEKEETAKRLAGAHDIAREYWDFNDTDAIQAFYRAQAEDYARKTDAAALAAIKSTATGSSTADSLLKAAAKAAQEVRDKTDGFDATSIIINSSDWLDLLDISAMDVAAFLSDMLGIDPGSFMYDSSITAGTVIAVARPAIKFRELPGSPIRVTAENIPNGGRDSGLFGYYLAHVQYPDGVRKVTFNGGTGGGS